MQQHPNSGVVTITEVGHKDYRMDNLDRVKQKAKDNIRRNIEGNLRLKVEIEKYESYLRSIIEDDGMGILATDSKGHLKRIRNHIKIAAQLLDFEIETKAVHDELHIHVYIIEDDVIDTRHLF